MKENTDPHQIVISREYFDKLVALARDNDHTARRRNHPNQTIVGRILWHARKYNAAYRLQESQFRFAEAQQYKADKERVINFVNRFRNQVITVVRTNGVLESFRVIEISRKDKLAVRCKTTRKPDEEFFFAENVHMRIPKLFFYEIKRQQ